MTESSQRGDYERRIKRLEDNDEKIFNSLEQIKDGQHNQSLINQKMNFTLDSINRERELESQNKKRKSKKYQRHKNVGFRIGWYYSWFFNRSSIKNVFWCLKEVSYHVRIIFRRKFLGMFLVW